MILTFITVIKCLINDKMVLPEQVHPYIHIPDHTHPCLLDGTCNQKIDHYGINFKRFGDIEKSKFNEENDNSRLHNFIRATGDNSIGYLDYLSNVGQGSLVTCDISGRICYSNSRNGSKLYNPYLINNGGIFNSKETNLSNNLNNENPISTTFINNNPLNNRTLYSNNGSPFDKTHNFILNENIKKLLTTNTPISKHSNKINLDPNLYSVLHNTSNTNITNDTTNILNLINLQHKLKIDELQKISNEPIKKPLNDSYIQSINDSNIKNTKLQTLNIIKLNNLNNIKINQLKTLNTILHDQYAQNIDKLADQNSINPNTSLQNKSEFGALTNSYHNKLNTTITDDYGALKDGFNGFLVGRKFRGISYGGLDGRPGHGSIIKTNDDETTPNYKDKINLNNETNLNDTTTTKYVGTLNAGIDGRIGYGKWIGGYTTDGKWIGTENSGFLTGYSKSNGGYSDNGIYLLKFSGAYNGINKHNILTGPQNKDLIDSVYIGGSQNGISNKLLYTRDGQIINHSGNGHIVNPNDGYLYNADGSQVLNICGNHINSHIINPHNGHSLSYNLHGGHPYDSNLHNNPNLPHNAQSINTRENHFRAVHDLHNPTYEPTDIYDPNLHLDKCSSCHNACCSDISGYLGKDSYTKQINNFKKHPHHKHSKLDLYDKLNVLGHLNTNNLSTILSKCSTSNTDFCNGIKRAHINGTLNGYLGCTADLQRHGHDEHNHNHKIGHRHNKFSHNHKIGHRHNKFSHNHFSDNVFNEKEVHVDKNGHDDILHENENEHKHDDFLHTGAHEYKRSKFFHNDDHIEDDEHFSDSHKHLHDHFNDPYSTHQAYLDDHGHLKSDIAEHNLTEHNINAHNLTDHNLTDHNINAHNLTEHNINAHNLNENNLTDYNLINPKLITHNHSNLKTTTDSTYIPSQNKLVKNVYHKNNFLNEMESDHFTFNKLKNCTNELFDHGVENFACKGKGVFGSRC